MNLVNVRMYVTPCEQLPACQTHMLTSQLFLCLGVLLFINKKNGHHWQSLGMLVCIDVAQHSSLLAIWLRHVVRYFLSKVPGYNSFQYVLAPNVAKFGKCNISMSYEHSNSWELNGGDQWNTFFRNTLYVKWKHHEIEQSRNFNKEKFAILLSKPIFLLKKCKKAFEPWLWTHSLFMSSCQIETTNKAMMSWGEVQGNQWNRFLMNVIIQYEKEMSEFAAVSLCGSSSLCQKMTWIVLDQWLYVHIQ